jgi:hypothetical protein
MNSKIKTISLYMSKPMSSTLKIAKSFTIEPAVNEYVTATKGSQSASERVNELLKRAIIEEQNERLETEAAAFFAEANKHRAGTLAFQEAALSTFDRD